ncbi:MULTISPECIES: hypothetical protein [unclassified Burkholderia]|uniref:hypothetical protein n=1 Tax=unclassified Burkholderia TaxID=2613784 RepID=UPI00075C6D4C|nr:MULTISPECIES: hypothetical protein [unclassified Burkholderia]KUY56308.1 hypothetical protein WS45_17465 [Burkholderia sp. RF2-non_BP3]KUY70944.1 hypothetical protein WS46_31080 [Burkholderia sp. RF4-BP95]KUZ03831.1 hypothetical protein WS48_32580 [Burkholderia sp. RF7-non_BP1]KUZ05035.1 hypothetical protein WS49_07040 [Burkholderia sp. RF7-non_BP4]
MMVTTFLIANSIVAAVCIWITIARGLPTGWWGLLGFSIIGVTAANLFKPIHMQRAIDAPETLMMVGTAIVCARAVVKRAFW